MVASEIEKDSSRSRNLEISLLLSSTILTLEIWMQFASFDIMNFSQKFVFCSHFNSFALTLSFSTSFYEPTIHSNIPLRKEETQIHRKTYQANRNEHTCYELAENQTEYHFIVILKNMKGAHLHFGGIDHRILFFSHSKWIDKWV